MAGNDFLEAPKKVNNTDILEKKLAQKDLQEELESTDQGDGKIYKPEEVAIEARVGDNKEAIPIKQYAWDVIPADSPWQEVKVSQIVDFFEQGYDRDEIAIMIGHSRHSVDLMCMKYKALSKRRAKTSNRLPFMVIDDSVNL